MNGIQNNGQQNARNGQMVTNYPQNNSRNDRANANTSQELKKDSVSVQLQKSITIKARNKNQDEQKTVETTMRNKQTEIRQNASGVQNGKKDLHRNNPQQQVQQKSQGLEKPQINHKQQKTQPLQQNMKKQQRPQATQYQSNQSQKAQNFQQKQNQQLNNNNINNKNKKQQPKENGSQAGNSKQQHPFKVSSIHEKQLNELRERINNIVVSAAKNDKTDDSSDALKKLLGIPQTSETIPTAKLVAADASADCLNQNIITTANPQQELLASLFNDKDKGFNQINPQALPKPPSNWTGQSAKNKASEKIETNIQAQLNPLQQFQQNNPHLFQNHQHPPQHIQNNPNQMYHPQFGYQQQQYQHQQNQLPFRPPPHPNQFHPMPITYTQPHAFHPPPPPPPHQAQNMHHMHPQFIPFREPPHLFNR